MVSETEPLSGVQGDGAGDRWLWAPWTMKASSLPGVSSGRQPGEGSPDLVSMKKST